MKTRTKESVAKQRATVKAKRERLLKQAPAIIHEAKFYLHKAVLADPPRKGRLEPRQIFMQLALAALEGRL